MSRVFIIGASGFVGSHVAQAFRREGYIVTGLTRTEEKAKTLRSHEIIAIVGTAQDSKNWEAAAEQADIIVEAMSDFQDPKASSLVQSIIERIIKKSPGKLVIYTSGIWVYGSNPKVVDENDKLNPPNLVKGREYIEKAYADMGAVVARLGVVYGKQGGITGLWTGAIKSGKAEFPGTGNHSMTFIHCNDLADAYIKMAQKKNSVKGQIFNITGQPEKVKNCIEALAAVIGYKGEIKFHPAADPLSECLALDQHISNQKAKAILGWHPKHPSFVEGAEQYYNAL